jgi:NADH-quinone oxidoreductase subunit N
MQTDFKRMMAYSSVSHVGYLLMSLLVVNQQTQGIIVFYLIAYSLASIGVFACLMILNPNHNNGNSFEIFKGLGKRSPGLAIVLTICLLSLSGIPPLPGFFAKYMLFQQAISQYLWLVIIGICGSAISIYYYFRAITYMFFTEDTENTVKVETNKNYAGYLVVAIACISIIILACFPAWFLK